MIEWIVTSAVLIAVVIALRFILKGKIGLRLQYALWLLVLVRLLVPVSFADTGISVMNVIKQPAENSAVTDTVSDPSDGKNPNLTNVESDPLPSGEALETHAELNPPNRQHETDALGAETGTPVTASAVLLSIWTAGVIVTGLWLMGVNLRFALNLKKTRRALTAFDCRIPVYVSEAVETPCLFGLFRPAIYVTPDAAAQSGVLRHAVEHELTHLRHGDHIWSLLRGVCISIHWYNPLVWWAAGLSRNDAELACDEATIKRIGEEERAEYGRTLIGMTCKKRTAPLLAATTMTGSKNSIKERITLIAKKPKTSFYTLIAVVAIAAVAVGCTFTGAKAEKKSGAISPADAVDDLFASGDVSLTLHLADSGAYRTYIADMWNAERFKALLSSYEWTEKESPDSEPGDFWLTAVSADEEKIMTFRSGGAGTLQYSDGNVSTYWRALQIYDLHNSIADDIRWTYDNLDEDCSRISFSLSGSAEDAADHFVHTAYVEHMLNLAPGNMYGISDYKVVDWGVIEVSGDGSAVVGWFDCAVIPLDMDSPGIWAGNTVLGTGEYEGRLIYFREFVLRKQENNQWRCIDLGTGGAVLPDE